EVESLFTDCKVTCLFRDDADENHPKISQRGLSRFAEVVWLIEK
ncbi:MAG: thiopurine S-methyltransferase, partial [Vibrio sp.]|nr:thiopurine S-methyltransferase [Vibrio sp.]